jgi:alpha-acetolactate decarboxylase
MAEENSWFGGCFSASGVGTLKRIDGKMNGEAYHKVLVREVLPEMKKLTKNEKTEIVWLYQHDNCNVHQTKKCKRYLEKKQKKEGSKSWIGLASLPTSTH